MYSVGRLERDAAADVSGRRPQDARPLRLSARVARRTERKARQFPLFKFWGPATDISSSQWIADATLHVMADAQSDADVLPICRISTTICSGSGRISTHPRLQEDLKEIDGVCGQLIEAAERRGAGHRRLRIRHHAGHRGRPYQPRAAPGGADRRARGNGARIARRAARRRPLRWPTISSRMSMCAIPAASPRWRAARGARRRGAGAGRGRQARRRARPSALRRAGRDLGGRPLVQLLLLARRRPRARLRAHRRYPPQARLRPGRAVPRSRDPLSAPPRSAGGWPSASSASATLLDVISLKDTQLVKGSHGRLTDDPNAGPAGHQLTAGAAARRPLAATDFKAAGARRTFWRDAELSPAHIALGRERNRNASAQSKPSPGE